MGFGHIITVNVRSVPGVQSTLEQATNAATSAPIGSGGDALAIRRRRGLQSDRRMGPPVTKRRELYLDEPTVGPSSQHQQVVFDVLSWHVLESLPLPPSPPPPAPKRKFSAMAISTHTLSFDSGFEPPLPAPPPPTTGYAPKYNSERLLMDDVSTVFFITNMCGQGAATTPQVSPHLLFTCAALSTHTMWCSLNPPVSHPQDLEAVLFGGGSEDSNLSSYFSTCSHGIAALNPNNTLIFTVDLPCR
jgi:hypothetical protein